MTPPDGPSHERQTCKILSKVRKISLRARVTMDGGGRYRWPSPTKATVGESSFNIFFGAARSPSWPSGYPHCCSCFLVSRMICASNIDLMCSSHVSSEVQNSSPERLTRCDENSEGGRHQSYIGSNEQYAPNPAGCFCFGDRPRVYTKDKIDMRLFSFFVQTGGGCPKNE